MDGPPFVNSNTSMMGENIVTLYVLLEADNCRCNHAMYVLLEVSVNLYVVLEADDCSCQPVCLS